MSQSVLVLTLALAFGAIAAVGIAMRTAAATRAIRALVILTIAVASAAVAYASFASGLRVNLTPSMPIGIYRLEHLPPGGVERGDIVAVCAPTDAARLGRRRGYLSDGPCPSHTELLLKAVAGVAGDGVTVMRGVDVDGCLLPDSVPVAFDRAGRRLESWPAGSYRLGRGQVWLYADNHRSWDSRYWGPADTADIRARALPLLVFPPFRGEPDCGAARSAGPHPRPARAEGKEYILCLICVVFL